jgi:hypothetical protein
MIQATHKENEYFGRISHSHDYDVVSVRVIVFGGKTSLTGLVKFHPMELIGSNLCFFYQNIEKGD